MAHYDANGEVKPYVLHLLEALRRLPSEIVFISSSPTLDAASEDQLKRLGISPRLVDNRGYDFAMWQSALHTVDLEAIDELILTNSSVFGPVGSLSLPFEEMRQHDLDFWGMTDNFEMGLHLQSYFLVFRPRAFKSEAFAQFFRSVLPYRNKRQVILSYELGLSVFLTEHGLRGGAFQPAAELWRDRRTLLRGRYRKHELEQCPNPTIYLAQELVEGGMPLVKVEALRDNPGRVDLKALRRVMEEHGYPMELVHVG